MKSSIHLLSVRRLLSAKLGRCYFCIRSSMAGTLVGWSAYAALVAVWPNTIVLTVMLLIASSFTILTLAHWLASVSRYRRALQDFREGKMAQKPPESLGFGRREFIWMALKAGTATMFIAAFQPFLFGQNAGPCGGQAPGAPITGSGSTKEDAEADYERNATSACDTLCASLGCFTGKCARSGAIGITKSKCKKQKDGSWVCNGTLTACPCGCFECSGTHTPPPGANVAMGTGATQVAARNDLTTNGQSACTSYCATINDCSALGAQCKDTAPVTFASTSCKKSGKNEITCVGVIATCTCGCGGS